MSTSSTPGTLRCHQNPRCSCPECRAFDNSATLPMQHLATNPVMMDAIDTETGERCTCYYHPGSSRPYLVKTPATAPRDCPKQRAHPSFHALLREVVLERIEKGVHKHPFFWLCLSTLFR